MNLRDLSRRKAIDDIVQEVRHNEALAEHGHGGGGLRRNLGVRDLVGLGIAAVVGAGIFSTIGGAAVHGGPAVSLLFVFTALACAFSALCYAEFAAAIPIAGSAYTYAYASFGELVAWIIGWDLLMEYAIGNIAVAISWSDYFTELTASWGLHVPHWLSMDYITASRGYDEALATLTAGMPLEQLTHSLRNAYLAWTQAPVVAGIPIIADLPALGIVVFITYLVYIGIRESKRASNAMVLIKIGIILFVIIVGAFYIDASNWTPFAPNGFGGVMAGVSSVFFAYIGFDAITTTAEECKNPRRDLPRGIFLSLIICTLLYVLISLVLTGMVPYDTLGVGDPMAYVFTQVGMSPETQNWITGVIAISAIVAMTSGLLVFQMGQPRIWLSMSRDGLLPPVFSRIHPRYRTPSFSTILTGVVVGVPCLFMNLSEVTELTSIGTLFAFVLVCGGVLRLQLMKSGYRSRFRLTSFALPQFNLPLFHYGVAGSRRRTVSLPINVYSLGFVFVLLLFWVLDRWAGLWAFFSFTPDEGQHLLGAITHRIPKLLFFLTCVLIVVLSARKPLPLVPVAGLLSCLYLMAEVPTASWIRFGGWLLGGLVVYFLYGYRNSKLRKAQQRA